MKFCFAVPPFVSDYWPTSGFLYISALAITVFDAPRSQNYPFGFCVCFGHFTIWRLLLEGRLIAVGTFPCGELMVPRSNRPKLDHKQDRFCVLRKFESGLGLFPQIGYYKNGSVQILRFGCETFEQMK